jgi:hypothetical protein
VEKGGTDPGNTHEPSLGKDSGRFHDQAASLEGQRSGRSSERVMAPLVAFSISIARSGVTFLFCWTQYDTAMGVTPMALAKALRDPK